VSAVRVVEVFADVVCPFTHAGLSRLVDERRRRDRPDVVLRCRSWPLELVNGAPLDPAVVAEEIEALRRSVAPGLFAGFDPARFPRSSVPALALAAAAYDTSLAAGEAVSLGVRRALFEEGLDLQDPAVLDAVAAAAGLDPATSGGAATAGAGGRARVEADWAEGRARGVVGSPHFFVGDTDVFCPTLTIAHEGGRFDVEVDWQGLEAFLAACFG